MKSFFFKALSGLLLLAFLSSCSGHVDLRTLWLNREGKSLLVAGRGESAQKKYIEALQYDPLLPELQLNLGLAYEVSQQPDNAMKQYESAQSFASEDLQKFVSYFNQAQLYGKQQKVEEALKFYQMALDLKPDSKEVKTNIELLIKQNEGGSGQNKKDDQEQKQDQKKDQGKDQQDQDDKNKDQNKDQKDDKDKKDPKDQDQKKEFQPNQKYKPREFKGELSPADIKKILGEIKQQEQKIRAEYNKKNDFKEQPRDKDW